MTKPVTIPNTFATATTAIPLSQLDSDFSTVATALNDANTYSNYAADTGVANAYVVTLTGVSTTYSAGLRIQFKAGNANTGASTLNVNGGGTKNITFQDASALSSGAIAANAIVDVMYDGTQFLLMNDPAGTVGTGDVVGPASATANAIVRFDSTTGKLVKNSVVTIADSTGDVAGVGALSATGNVSFDGGTFVFNESGADKDFRIEGDTEPNLFFTDASTDRVGIGTSSPGVRADIVDNSSNNQGQLRLSSSGGFGTRQTFVSTSTNGRTYQIGCNFWVGNGEFSIVDSNASTERLQISSAGNLGLGVTPSAWTGNTKAVQVKSAALWNDDYAGKTSFGYNTYQDTDTTYKYIGSFAAGRYDIAQNIHRWHIAPSGTAGNAITFTQAMTLDASGNLVVGGTSASNRLDIQSAVTGTYSSSTQQIVARLYNVPASLGSGTNSAFLSLQTSTDGGSSNPIARIGVVAESYGSNNGAFVVATRDSSGITERARITSGGNLLVGTTTDAQKLTVEGNQRFTGSQVGTKIENRQTAVSVSTATTILDDAGALGRFVIVNGEVSGNRFCDLVLCSTSVSPTVVASFTSLGSPAARTYTRSGSALQLAMASGTYTVTALALGY